MGNYLLVVCKECKREIHTEWRDELEDKMEIICDELCNECDRDDQCYNCEEFMNGYDKGVKEGKL